MLAHESKVVKNDIEHKYEKSGLMQQYATWMCNLLFLNGWKVITIQRCTGLIFTIYRTFRVNTWLISRSLDPLTRGPFTEHSYLIKATFRWTYVQFRDTQSLWCHAGMFSYLEPNNSWRNPWSIECRAPCSFRHTRGFAHNSTHQLNTWSIWIMSINANVQNSTNFTL